MATAVRKHHKTKAHNGRTHNGTRHYTRKYTTKTKLPQEVAQQLEKIYFQSRKKVIKHPYQTAGGIILSLGLASGAYFLVRYLRNQY